MIDFSKYVPQALKFIRTDGVVIENYMPTATSEEWLGYRGKYLKVIAMPETPPIPAGTTKIISFENSTGLGLVLKDAFIGGFATGLNTVNVSIYKIKGYTVDTSGTTLVPENLNDIVDYIPTTPVELDPTITGGDEVYIGSVSVFSTNQTSQNVFKELPRDIYLSDGYTGLKFVTADGELNQGQIGCDYVELSADTVAKMKTFN